MYTEYQLIQGVIKGENKAIRFLLQKYQNYVYTVCHSVLRTKQESEEATQDTFLKIIRALPKYVKKGKLSTWIYSIAYRTALDYLKSRKNTIGLDNYDKSLPNEVEEGMRYEERNKALENLVDKLSPEDARLIRMYYLGEMSIKEVASHSAISESNVKIKLFRARKTLSQLANKENFSTEFIIN